MVVLGVVHVVEPVVVLVVVLLEEIVVVEVVLSVEIVEVLVEVLSEEIVVVEVDLSEVVSSKFELCLYFVFMSMFVTNTKILFYN